MKNICYDSLLDRSIIKNKTSEFILGTFENPLLNIYNQNKGIFKGFGGAITESSGYNYSLLNKENKKKFLELIVGESGLKYSYFRLHIGSCDFSLKEYTYINDKDIDLKTFNISNDKKYIIPLIKDLISHSKQKIHFIASCWSAPAFMKDNNNRLNGGCLKIEYYSLFAQYIINYLLAYQKEGINVEALTIQNEPKAKQTWESCNFTKEQELEFAKVLKEKLIENNLNVDLYCWDHNKERLVERGEYLLRHNDIFKGIAFHWYSGNHFDAISCIKDMFPKVEVIETEFCISHTIDETDSNYAYEIINNIRNGANAIIEWNILLDKNGGPYHDRYNNKNCGCEAPIMLDENNNLVITKIYKEMYMFSHYIKNDSDILWTSSYNEKTKILATKKDDEIVVNIFSDEVKKDAKIYINNEFLPINLNKNEISTIVIKL